MTRIGLPLLIACLAAGPVAAAGLADAELPLSELSAAIAEVAGAPELMPAANAGGPR